MDAHIEKQFKEYLRHQKYGNNKDYKIGTINCYFSTIKNIAEEVNIPISDLEYHIDEIIQRYSNTEEDEKGHKRKSNALKRYKEFLDSLWNK